MAPAHAMGEAMAWAGPGYSQETADAADQAAPANVSAALGGMRNMLDRDFGGFVHLERAHMLVEAMMTVMPDMMAAHLGIGVQHAWLHLFGLDNGRLGRVAGSGRQDGGGENGNCEQRGGNGLQHGRLL